MTIIIVVIPETFKSSLLSCLDYFDRITANQSDWRLTQSFLLEKSNFHYIIQRFIRVFLFQIFPASQPLPQFSIL